MSNTAKNCLVIVLLAADGRVAGMRMRGYLPDLKTPDTVPPDAEEINRMAEAYAKTVRLGKYSLQILGPMTEAESQVVYDAIPGGRCTDAQINELARRMGPSYESTRAATPNMRKP